MLRIIRDMLRTNAEFAFGMLLLLITFSLMGLSFVSPHGETELYIVPPDLPPSSEYWLGTTSRGQDVFWQITAALRNSLAFGIIVAVISRVLALSVGLVSGYVGGRVDQVLMAINDTLSSLPNVPILLLFYFVMRDHMTWLLLALVAGLLGWTYDSRLFRSVAMGLRTRDFTRHAVFSGMRTPRILLGEHLPFVMPILFFTTMNNLIWAIGIEVMMAVLGFTDVGAPTIGGMIYWANVHSAMVSGVWWWIAFPMLFVAILFLGLFLVAMSVNEFIDPRSRLARMGAA